MNTNQSISEGLGLLASIDPASQSAGTVTSAWFPVANFNSFMALISAGTLGASATLDAKIQQAQDGSGTGAKDLTGKAITQMTQAGGGSNKQAMINFRATDLDTTNGFGYVRVSMTVGTAASLVSAYLFGGVPLFEPVKDANASPAINLGATTVAQIVQ